MVGRVFMRPKPLGHVIDVWNGWGRLFPGTVINQATITQYSNAGVPFPGVWRVEGIGAGGGGGGQDSYYSGQPGQGGRPGGYVAAIATLGGLPLTLVVGRGGSGGIASTSPTNGSYGGPTGVTQNGLSVINCSGGEGGLLGSLGSASNRDPVPPLSNWYSGTVGRGGYGSQNLGGGQSGSNGNLRFTLIG